MLSPRERRIVLLIAIIAFALRLALVFRPEARLFSRPYIDDTFYALGCAYNLAQGHGLTSDGIHPTNGIQPLIVFLDVPLFVIAGTNKALGIQLTIALQAVIDSLAIYFFALLISHLRRPKEPDSLLTSAPVIGAVLWATLFNFFRQDMNGLETGLYSIGILCALLRYLALQRDTTKQSSVIHWGLFGLLLGLLVLARIDAVFLILGIIAIELWRKKAKAILPLFVMGVASILISSPWWIFNYTEFGSVMPQSGQSEALGVHFGSNIFDGAVALADILAAAFYFPYQEFPIWSRWLWCAVVPVGVLYATLQFGLVKKVRERYDLSAIMPLALASVGYVIFYVLFFAAWWFLYRYFQPVRILWTLLLAMGLAAIIESLSTMPLIRKRLTVGVLSLLTVAGIAWNANRYIANFTTQDIYPGYLVGKWALKHPDVKIGMEQSGTASFVAPNITNLDGKVNPEALRARSTNSIGRYILAKKFDYIIDWEIISGPLAEKANIAGAHFTKDSTIGTMSVYRNHQ